MSDLTKLEFVAFDIIGNNYLSWTLNSEIHLDVMNLGAVIKEGNQGSRKSIDFPSVPPPWGFKK